MADVKLSVLIAAALQGKESFKEAQDGLKGVGGGADIAAFAMKALSAVAIGAFFVDSVMKAAEFSDSLKYLQVATDSTNEEMQALSDTAKEVSLSFGDFSGTEVVKAMTTMSKAGYGAAGSMEYVDDIGRLAIASMSGIEDTAYNVSRAMKSFSLQTTDTGRIVDTFAYVATNTNVSVGELTSVLATLGPIATSAGLSFEETTAALTVLTDSGLAAGRAGMTLRSMILDLQNPSEKAAQKMYDLGIQIYELPPAAMAAQRALNADYKELEKLQQQMDEVSASSQKLQAQLDQLNLQEAKNNLEIMKIRDAAADQNRELTQEEMDIIAAIESANRDLSISQSELGIQQDELNIKEKELSTSMEATQTSVAENSQAFNDNKGEMKGLAEIAEQFQVSLAGLTEQEKVQALAMIVGERSVASMQVLMKSTTTTVDGSTKSLQGFTTALENSSGTAQQASDTIQTGLGNTIESTKNQFEVFQLELVEKFEPELKELFRIVMEDLIPVLVELIPIIAALAKVIVYTALVLEPVIKLFTEYPWIIQAVVIAYIAWIAVQWALNVAMTANPIGMIIVAIGLLILAIVLLVMNWRVIYDAIVNDPKVMAIALIVLLGVVGLLIFAIIEIYKNWDTIYKFIVDTSKAIGDALAAPFIYLYDKFIEIKDNIMQFIDDLKSGKIVKDAISNIGGSLGIDVSGLDLPSFGEGGIVPGPLGEPQLVIAHGGEPIGEGYTTQPQNNVSVDSHDSITVMIKTDREITDSEVDRISSKLANQITNKKRRATRSALGV